MNGEGFIYSNGQINYANAQLINFPVQAPLGDAVPASPSGSNDEFTDSNSLSNWQMDNISTTTFSFVFGTWLQMTLPGTGTNPWRGISKAAGGGNWDIRCKVAGQRDFGGSTDAAIGFYTNAGTGFTYGFGDAVAGYTVLHCAQLSAFNYNGEYAAVSTHAGNVINWLRVTFNGSTYTCYFSPDGNLWSRHVFNIPNASVTRIGIGGRNSSTVPVSNYFDWVRFF